MTCPAGRWWRGHERQHHQRGVVRSTARTLRPDLVLLDVYLPDIHGRTVLRELRTQDTTDGTVAETIVVTAAQDVETVRGAVHGGERLESFASMHRRLAAFPDEREVTQRQVDEVFGARPRSTDTSPKGVAAETASVVADTLRTATRAGLGLSATECAEQTELSRASARRYLEYFVDAGRAEVRLRYGSTGRPERRFRWAEGGSRP
ncbi:response regulator of citrate/malate metabolism [Actinoalloteichus sp. GBA129-24]|nr:response regulator of citrate/malate metabolism [Actinoalloteichus sp. GBA129-24]